jgi:tight adherence protein B
MNPLVYLLVIVGLAAVLMLVLALRSGRGEEARIERRLDRYVEEQKTRSGEEIDIDEEAKQLSRFTQSLNEAVERRGFGERIANRLAQASVKLTVGEYLILNFISIVLGGAVGWLIFRNNILFISGFIGGFFAPRIVINVLKAQRLRKFNDQLGDTINLLVNGLRSGYSMPQAMDTVADNMPPPISEEFRRVGIEITLGVSLEDALANMLRRVDSADLDLMITAINVQHQVGGNLAEILDIISHTIRERVRIQGEIKTLTAQGEITGYVISGLPFALTGILFLMNREYMLRMFQTPCGWIMTGTAVTIIVLGFVAMRKVVQIEV